MTGYDWRLGGPIGVILNKCLAFTTKIDKIWMKMITKQDLTLVKLFGLNIVQVVNSYYTREI